MRLALKITIVSIAICASVAGYFLFWPRTSQADSEITWGVTFSESQAAYLGLDPREVYSALIHDLGARNIKIHINWDSIEKSKDTYDCSALDAAVDEAKKNHVKLILVIGMKTGRWPECHTPAWFSKLDADERQAEIVRYVSAVAERYKNSSAVEYWQVENEPFIHFGECPSWYYADATSLLHAEVDAIKTIDNSRKIIISDSGELSTWTGVAPIADIVGITMYRSSWNPTQKIFGINPYAFLAPEFYSAKAAWIQKQYDKPVISVELQAEPWASVPLTEASLTEQEKSMNPALFAENIAFAKETGLHAFYFWGAEWWYYMKVKHDKPEIWQEAKELFAK